ncbi:hypothetical protein LUZ63_020091 [Rhynchospora breviuscula]|uniref:DUF1990 domain-containing protein n=1 Tax=Rhynchospora breviuscula TaxID=2022672 RepID=A0A9P9Z974_9POAL|nr:hypothetical protein LUZ63_020091 [Rhynchospora breviuscula]
MTELTYAEVGATGGPLPSGYHHVRAERVIGYGRIAFEQAADALLCGAVQRRVGAIVRLSQTPVRVGTRFDMRLGPFGIPCLVVWAERGDEHAGFAYGSLPRHPECGEERFELTLAPTGEVTFTITAFSRPGRWFTRLAWPLNRMVQKRMTERYLRTLDS